jgi:hypothetical protein
VGKRNTPVFTRKGCSSTIAEKEDPGPSADEEWRRLLYAQLEKVLIEVHLETLAQLKVNLLYIHNRYSASQRSDST